MFLIGLFSINRVLFIKKMSLIIYIFITIINIIEKKNK